MNYEYIKKLLECGRHGRVIRLIKDNIHTWSINDYMRLYDICFGYKHYANVSSKKYFSESCILYMLDHINSDTICKNVRSKHVRRGYYFLNASLYCNSVRLIKHKLTIITRIKLYKFSHDTTTYFVVNRLYHTINTAQHSFPSVYLLYDDPECIDMIIKSGVHFGYNIRSFYKKCNYITGDKYYAKVCALKPYKTDFLNRIYKCKYLYKYKCRDRQTDDNVVEFCKDYIKNKCDYKSVSIEFKKILWIDNILSKYFTCGKPNKLMHNLIGSDCDISCEKFELF